MKKLLLFLGILSIPMSQTVTAQSLTFDALPATAELGGATNFTLSYTSTVPAKIGIDLFVFGVDGSGTLTQDWSTWKAGITSDALPVTSAASAQTITLTIPGNLELSSALASGKTYVWALSLRDASDAWITGSQHATTLVAASTGVTNAVQFTGSTVTQVNAGSTATIGYSYSLAQDGIVKIALSKYSAAEVWMSDVASYIVNPAMATTATQVQATADIVIPADAVPTASLSNGEMYKWEVSLFTPDWSSYLSGVKSNVTVGALAGLAANKSNSFYVYPNPASDRLNLSGLDVQNTEVFDVTGKLLVSTTQQNTIDVSSFVSGIYFVKINNAQTIKFIKN